MVLTKVTPFDYDPGICSQMVTVRVVVSQSGFNILYVVPAQGILEILFLSMKDQKLTEVLSNHFSLVPITYGGFINLLYYD